MFNSIKKYKIFVIIFLLLLGGFFVYIKLDKKNSKFIFKRGLPVQYCNYKTIEEYSVDIRYDDYRDKNFKSKLVVINKNYMEYMGISKIILIREDGYFLELPGYGEGFDWWKVGDLNDNGLPDVAVLYQNMGSGSFNPFYFYEWNGENFEVKLNNSNLFNWNKMADLDNDGALEIIHEFRVFQFAWSWKEVYKWDKNESKFIKSNDIFPEIYEEWLKDKELNPNGSFKTDPHFWDTQDGKTVINTNNCLKEKAILNSQGIFADIDECYNF